MACVCGGALVRSLCAVRMFACMLGLVHVPACFLFFVLFLSGLCLGRSVFRYPCLQLFLWLFCSPSSPLLSVFPSLVPLCSTCLSWGVIFSVHLFLWRVCCGLFLSHVNFCSVIWFCLCLVRILVLCTFFLGSLLCDVVPLYVFPPYGLT